MAYAEHFQNWGKGNDNTTGFCKSQELWGDPLYAPFALQRTTETRPGMRLRHTFETEVDNADFDRLAGANPGDTDIAGFIGLTDAMASAFNYEYGSLLTSLPQDLSGNYLIPGISSRGVTAGVGDEDSTTIAANMFMANVRTITSPIYGLLDVPQLGFCVGVYDDNDTYTGQELPFEAIGFYRPGLDAVEYTRDAFKTGTKMVYSFATYTVWFLTTNATIETGFGAEARDLGTGQLVSPQTNFDAATGYITYIPVGNLGGGGGGDSIIDSGIVS